MNSTPHTLDFQYCPKSTAGDTIQTYIDQMTSCGWLIIDAFPYDNRWGDHLICLHVIQTPIAISNVFEAF